MSEPRLDHVGLAARDLDAAAEWYCAAFGYQRELTLRVDPIGPEGNLVELLERP
jgi:lactoylglutathione lyase